MTALGFEGDVHVCFPFGVYRGERGGLPTLEGGPLDRTSKGAIL